MNPIVTGLAAFLGVMMILVLATIAASMELTLGNAIVLGVAVICAAAVFETGIIVSRGKK